jgi:coenzyme F420-reducing hydrogenase gamma subunit
MTKPKVGFYGLTGCAGCQLSVLFSEDEIVSVLGLIDIVSFPFIREKNIDQHFDICIVEGLVADKHDLETLKKLRENSSILVAIGACAHTGNVPAYRHYTLKENYQHLLYEKKEGIQDIDPTPLDSWVKVDYTIPGCPPDKREIMNFIKALLLGKEPLTYSSPVCVECRRNNNLCLLEEGKLCLGPITRGGCNSVCTNGSFECWGCRGQTDDANIPAFVALLQEKGFKREEILKRMREFVGLKLPESTMVFFNGNNNA